MERERAGGGVEALVAWWDAGLGVDSELEVVEGGVVRGEVEG